MKTKQFWKQFSTFGAFGEDYLHLNRDTGRSLRRACEKEERKKYKLKNTPPKKKSWLDD